MKVKEISVTYGRKVQLAQFEPVDYRESLIAELDEEDDVEEASKQLADAVEEHVEREIVGRILAKKMEDRDDE